MPVDMFEWRFRSELMKLPVFEPKSRRDPRVWPKPGSKEAEFPAWRALFSSCCLWGHSTGYRLFSYKRFYEYCQRAYTEIHPQKERFKRYFEGDLLEGMRQRMGVWYEMGIAETYLYVCLADAIEDQAKVGIVLYDPRADWKLKADLVVIINNVPMRVSAYAGDEGDRPNIEARREEIERIRKINNSQSAHWGNAQLDVMPTFEIARTENDMQVLNGMRVFSLPSIDVLLTRLYDQSGSSRRWLFTDKRSEGTGGH